MGFFKVRDVLPINNGDGVRANDCDLNRVSFTEKMKNNVVVKKCFIVVPNMSVDVDDVWFDDLEKV